jgi:ATP-dependent Clp protease adaptor protein ClpS
MKNSKPADPEIDVEEYEDVDISDAFSKRLIVWNDDVNSFEHVIETLIKVCKHTPQQAEQCTLMIHFKGKCAVKDGDEEELLTMKRQIISAGINATVE